MSAIDCAMRGGIKIDEILDELNLYEKLILFSYSIQKTKTMPRRSLWRENRWALRINPWIDVPKCWQEAYENTQILERNTRNAVGYMLEQKMPPTKPNKGNKISFGTVIVNHIAYDADADDKLVIKKSAKEKEISYETAPAEIATGKFMEKWILGLLTMQKGWRKFSCGSRKNLDAIIAASSITKEELAKDMRALWMRFLCKKIAILGYRSSWKLYPTFDEMKRDGLSGAWFKTGKKIERAPIFQKYLITIVQDPITAAIVIQRQMRRKLVQLSQHPEHSVEICKLRGIPSSETAPAPPPAPPSRK